MVSLRSVRRSLRAVKILIPVSAVMNQMCTLRVASPCEFRRCLAWLVSYRPLASHYEKQNKHSYICVALSSTLNRVMYMNAAIARVRTAETMTTHISSAVNVLRRRLRARRAGAAAAAEIIEEAHVIQNSLCFLDRLSTLSLASSQPRAPPERVVKRSRTGQADLA